MSNKGKSKGIGLMDNAKKLKDIAEEDRFLSFIGSLFLLTVGGLITGQINMEVGKFLIYPMVFLMAVASLGGVARKIGLSWGSTVQAEKEGETFKNRVETQFQAGAVGQILDTGIVFAEMVVSTLIEILEDGVVTPQEAKRMALLIKNSKKYIGSTFGAIGTRFPDWAKEWFGVDDPSIENIPISDDDFDDVVGGFDDIENVEDDVVSMNPDADDMKDDADDNWDKNFDDLN